MDKGVKLFGVRLNSNTEDCPFAMRKSVSMGNLTGYEAPSPSSSPPAAQPDLHLQPEDGGSGYASDDFVHTSSNSSTRERKKGVPWTEDEHGLFLIGLQRLGKGDWRGISRNFVKTRTPTQVASHAQKYFLRQSNINKRRRRSSLFDITPDKVACVTGQEFPGKEDLSPEVAGLSDGHKQIPADGCGMENDVTKVPPVTGFRLPLPPRVHSDKSDSTIGATRKAKEVSRHPETGATESFDPMQQSSGIPVVSFPVGIPSFDPHMLSIFSFYQWASMNCFDHQSVNKNIVRPTAVIPQGPVKMDESLKISELCLDTARPVMEPTPLSFKLMEEGSRHSAFHATSSVGTTDLDNQGSLGSAISVA